MKLKTELTKFGQEIFEKRYAYPGEKTWADCAHRVAKHVASAEKDDDKEKWFQKFYETIGSGDFIPGGRILFGSGRNGGQQNLLNCYYITPKDNVESIGKTIKDMYQISCGGGGVGFNFTDIRPKGDDIQNIKHSAPGSISVMKMINEIGNHVRAGASRRTALIALLEVSHPDLLEFLYVKLDKKELNNFNISVSITDEFLEACDKDEEWRFRFNNRDYFIFQLTRVSFEGTEESVEVVGISEEDALGRAREHYKKDWRDTFKDPKKGTLKARYLWDMIYSNSIESGEPGIHNISFANKHTNCSYFEDLCGVNPCQEINLPSYGNCTLGNVNLSNMVENGEVNWKRLANAVRVGIRFLDDVLTVNHFPIPECKEVAHRSRRIGLGVTGLAYMLIKLGLRYGSEKSLEFLDRLFTTIRDEAYKTSIYLARDKSPFSAFDARKYLNEEFAKTLPARIRMLIKEHGIRNAVMLTCPPTGTISIVHGVSTGIEPIFAAMYNRRYRDSNIIKEQLIVDPLFEQYIKEKKDLSNFVGAYDVTPEEHIKVQATIQRYIDNAISKTINLSTDSTPDGLSDVVLKYVPYLKGLTIYRAGSRGQEPLQAIPLTEDNIKRYISQIDQATSEIDENSVSCKIGGECGG